MILQACQQETFGLSALQIPAHYQIKAFDRAFSTPSIHAGLDCVGSLPARRAANPSDIALNIVVVNCNWSGRWHRHPHYMQAKLPCFVRLPEQMSPHIWSSYTCYWHNDCPRAPPHLQSNLENSLQPPVLEQWRRCYPTHCWREIDLWLQCQLSLW